MWGQVGLLLHIAATVTVGLRVLTRPRMEPSVRLAWIMIVEALPLVGVIGYLLFGEIRMNRGEAKRRADIRRLLTGLWTPSPQAVDHPPAHARAVLAANRAVGGFDAVRGSAVTLLPEDDSALDAVVQAIDAATDHVHMLFYIWLDDVSGRAVAQAAMRAARRGVDVRALVDGLGSRHFTRSATWAEMRAAGVDCRCADPVRLSLIRAMLQRVDLRNHRKIVVIDHVTGFTGSRNCADMAFRPKPRFAPWVDILVRVEGPVVRQMQAVFLQDWMSTTGADLGAMLTQVPPAGPRDCIAQVVATGPDGRPGSISDCLTTLILGADRRVTITTPYYVPDQPLDRAIRAAALRGVEVTMIVPARNDSLLVGATSEGFFGGLIEDGVQLWRFRPGLLHAKIVTVDGRMAMIGSANLDRRSFELNYEMNLMIVDPAVVADLDARQASYVARADRLDGPGIARWPVWRQVRNNLLAIASPVL